jgi:hypothetical protein
MFRRTRTSPTAVSGWTGVVIAPAVLLIALGCWVFFVPLVGPYFSFGFDTTTHWRFSQDHVLLQLLPGIAIAAAGLLMLVPSRLVGWLAGLLAVAAGIWLVIGPSLQALWSATPLQALPGTDAKTAIRWIAGFYGAGALAIYLGAQAQGLLERRPVTTVAPGPPPPAERRSDVEDPQRQTSFAGRT